MSDETNTPDEQRIYFGGVPANEVITRLDRVRSIRRRGTTDPSAKGSPDKVCKYCGEEDELHIDRVLMNDHGVLLQECAECGQEWSQDLSVRIPPVLHKRIALALRIDPGYSGASEFIRDAIRMKCEQIDNSAKGTEARQAETLQQTMLLARMLESEEEYED